MDSTFDLIPKIINGGIAGIVGVTCVFPIDLVKTLLQKQQSGANVESKYKSIPDCAVKTFRERGFFGMYRGLTINLLLITPEKVVKLVANDLFRHVLRKEEKTLTLPREMLAGAGAGMCQSIITTPMELLKIQLQVDDTTRVDQTATTTGSLKLNGASGNTVPPRPSATTIALQLYKDKGFFGLYEGYRATLLRDVPFSAIYFPLFAHLNAKGKRREGSNQAVSLHSFISGCIAGCTAAFLVTPFDVVKTRLQILKKGKEEQTYKGIIDCFVKVMKIEGPKAFFKGGFCRVLVIAPLFGIAQTVYFLEVAEFILGYEKSY